MGELLQLRWHRDSAGYTIEREGATTVVDADEDVNAHVVPRGGQPEQYTCKAGDPRILADLLNMAETHRGVLGFVNRWGLLAAPERETPHIVGEIIATKALLTELRDKGLPRSEHGIRLASLELVGGPDGQPAIRARTLEDFLWAQVFEGKHGAVSQCSVCKKFFLAKVTRKRAGKPCSPYMTGRSRESCSDACRSKAYRQRQGASRVRGGT